MYNVAKKHWEEIFARGHPPKPRAGHTMTYIGDSFLVLGGISGFNEY